MASGPQLFDELRLLIEKSAIIEAIEQWAEHWNDDPKPFVWKKTADEIITKVRRGRAALTGAKSATDH